MTTRQVLDLSEEEVALRAGILLTDHDVFRLIEGSPIEEWAEPLRLPPNMSIGIRPEFFEDFARVLRAAVGDLPDAEAPEMRRMKLLGALGNDAPLVLTAIEAFSDEAMKHDPPVINAGVVDVVTRNSHFSAVVINAALQILADNQNRSAHVLRPDFRAEQWSGALPLSDLFQTESVPADADAYLDQRFIDYLAARTDDLPRMHWRNFERLTAEYFSRLGYEVSLGPGSKDGGVDLRVWPGGSHELGPPLLLVQCKRYAKGRHVEIEHVKAFWADVNFEKADRALIATTASVSPDGKRTSAARGYPLEFAEAAHVRDWVRTMWRHSWEGVQQQFEVFYPLPPIYVGGLIDVGGNEDSTASPTR